MAFVFYDTETTGLRIGFDQIVQFAAIRTDHELNEIERFECRSRLLPYVVPHPQAMLTNGLSIGELTDPDLPSHYEMVMRLRRTLLEWSPAIFVGYNSMRFDEEMLRHALFQTVHPAYLTNTNKNCRADALGLALSASALFPASLTIPRNPDGRKSFRLADLASANGVDTLAAHHAMGDTLATLELCRLVRRTAPDAWQRFVRFSKKASVIDFLEAEEAFVLTEYFSNEAFHQPVVCLGPDPRMPNRRLCLHLGIDIDGLLRMSDADQQAMFARRPSPIRGLKVNAAPTVTELFEASDDMLSGAAMDELEEKARLLKQDTAAVDRLIANYLASQRELADPELPEQRIHAALPSRQDEMRMFSFHEVAWPDAIRLVDELEHPDLRTFAMRLIYCEARHHLSEGARTAVETEMMDRLVEQTESGFTIGDALTSINELMGSDPDHDRLLDDYRAYLVARELKVLEHRTKLAQPS